MGPFLKNILSSRVAVTSGSRRVDLRPTFSYGLHHFNYIKESIRSFVNPDITLRASCVIAQGRSKRQSLNAEAMRCEQSTMRFKGRLNPLWDTSVHPFSLGTRTHGLHQISCIWLLFVSVMLHLFVKLENEIKKDCYHLHHHVLYLHRSLTTTYTYMTTAYEEIFEHDQVTHLLHYLAVRYGWVFTPPYWQRSHSLPPITLGLINYNFNFSWFSLL